MYQPTLKTTRLLLSLVLTLAIVDTNDAVPTTDRSQTDQIDIPKSCVNRNESVAATKLAKICEDCAVHFNVLKDCREPCYSTEYVPACVKYLCYWDQKDDYRKWVEDLSGKKFAVWESAEVRLVDGSSEVMDMPMRRMIETLSFEAYCKTK